MLLQDNEEINFARSPSGLILEYARLWWAIQREFPGITLAAVRAQRSGWRSIEQIMSEN